jgi:hypothetical protein
LFDIVEKGGNLTASLLNTEAGAENTLALQLQCSPDQEKTFASVTSLRKQRLAVIARCHEVQRSPQDFEFSVKGEVLDVVQLP